MTSPSVWDRLNFHTIKVTGHPMINLIPAQTYLYEQLATVSNLELARGTVIWARSDQTYGDGPATFDLTPSSGSPQDSIEVMTDLSLPCLELETLLESINLFFNQTYYYQNFSLDELALLMKVFGYSGYQCNGQVVIFDLTTLRMVE